MLRRSKEFSPKASRQHGRRGKAIAAAGVLVVAAALLAWPERRAPLPRGAPAASPFRWDVPQLFTTLEREFTQARSAESGSLLPRFAARRAEGEALAASLAGLPAAALAGKLDRIAAIHFEMAALAAAQRQLLPSLQEFHVVARNAAMDAAAATDHGPESWEALYPALYRLVYGGRRALEEALLQGSTTELSDRLHFAATPCAGPSVTVLGETVCSGDILLSRGGAVTSALIARGNDYPGDFSHVALVHVDPATRTPVAIEAHLESGVGVSSLERYLGDGKRRILLLRPRSDPAAIAADPLLPHRAATRMRADATARHIPYDFAMDFDDDRRDFCSEVVYHAYESAGLRLWLRPTTMSAPGVVAWLSGMGVEHFTTLAPADLELDPRLEAIVEWRDREGLAANRIDDAVLDALLAGADAGDRLAYPWYQLPLARLAKAYSALCVRAGGTGPVPEGMTAGTSLRVLALTDRIGPVLRADTAAAASRFRAEHGYEPPYWTLVDLASAALEARRAELAPALTRVENPKSRDNDARAGFHAPC